MLLQPIYQVTQKAAGFEQRPEQEKTLQLVQASVHTALPHGPRGPGDPMLFTVLLADRSVAWNF